MNQFKKAKQKALQSGHQVENMADLQTAGIKQSVEETKPVKQPQEVTKEVIVESTPVVFSEPITPVVQQQENVTPEVIVNTQIPSEPIQIKAEAPVVVEEPINNIPDPVYEEIEITAEPEPISQPVQTPQPIPVPIRVASTPIVQEVTYTPPVATPVVSATKSTTTKKNIPNIFAPKNEAKSMRKSLVLKPTSVKIAENYCAKNGGSFNELIQTLLDNFIDEYGL